VSFTDVFGSLPFESKLMIMTKAKNSCSHASKPLGSKNVIFQNYQISIFVVIIKIPINSELINHLSLRRPNRYMKY